MLRSGSRHRFPIAVAAAIGVLALVPGFASASWQIQAGGDGSFSGTYTNDTGATTNGWSIQTADGSGNPVTSFTFEGKSCPLYAPYGSATCSSTYAPGSQHGDMDLAPGQQASFGGTTQKPVPAGGTFKACDTSDGATYNCKDITVANGGSGTGGNNGGGGSTGGGGSPGGGPTNNSAPPAALLTAFRDLDGLMTTIIHEADHGYLHGESLAEKILELIHDKASLISGNFGGVMLYGVPANVVIAGFDDIDVKLAFARFDVLKRQPVQSVVKILRAAQTRKQGLEKKFRDAAS